MKNFIKRFIAAPWKVKICIIPFAVLAGFIDMLWDFEIFFKLLSLKCHRWAYDTEQAGNKLNRWAWRD